MKNKAAIKISFLTFLVSSILLNLYFYIKYGINYLFTENLMIGIPLWTILLTYAAYGGTRYYHEKKLLFIPDGYENDDERLKEWSEYKLYMLSRFMKILTLMFGMAFPVYLLAYLDHSKELHSSPAKIVIFFLLAIGCGACYKILERRYIKHIQS